jgi:hypothetical protein
MAHCKWSFTHSDSERKHRILLTSVQTYSKKPIKRLLMLPHKHQANHLAMLTRPNTSLHHLDLEVNAICAVQRDMLVEKGLGRSARVRITALHSRFVEVQTGKVHCLASHSHLIQHGPVGPSIANNFRYDLHMQQHSMVRKVRYSDAP